MCLICQQLHIVMLVRTQKQYIEMLAASNIYEIQHFHYGHLATDY